MVASKRKLAACLLIAGSMFSGSAGSAQELEALPEVDLQAISEAVLKSACSSQNPIIWKRQTGSRKSEEASVLKVEQNGDIVIGGSTAGSLGGPNQGGTDYWVARYSSKGKLMSTKQFGSADNERLGALDYEGDILVAGEAQADGSFIAKYTPDGEEVWKQTLVFEQCNGSQTSDDVSINGISIDKNNSIVVTSTCHGTDGERSWDTIYIQKLGPTGYILWNEDSGISEIGKIYFGSTSIDNNNNIIISATKAALLWDSSVVITKYNTNGSLIWKKEIPWQFPDENFFVGRVATNRYGQIAVAANKEHNVWLAKYSSKGALLWERTFKIPGWGFIGGGWQNGLPAFDTQGNIIVAGGEGITIDNPQDVFIVKYASGGKFLWKRRIATPAYDSVTTPASDPLSNIIVAGSTNGALVGSNKGEFDAWLVKLKP